MGDFPVVSEGQWRERVERELRGRDFSSFGTETVEGLRLEPLYTAAGADGAARPGIPPVVRGIQDASSRPGPECCQRYDDADLGVVKQQIGVDTDNGVDGLWLQLDRAARLGLDPIAAVASEHVGVGGLPTYTVDDLTTLLADVDLAAVGLSIDAGANALPVAAVVLAALERLGVDAASVRLRFSADPLGALARDASLPASRATLALESASLARYCAANLPRARALVVSTGPYARAGADAIQELGFAMATVAEVLRTLEAAGVPPELAAGQIVVSFELGRDFLVQLCKLRAARLLWDKLQRACEIEPVAAFVHVASGHRTLSRQDPWVNMLRTTVQAATALIGGVDSLTTAAFDEVIGRPEARGRRVAGNTPTVLQYESHLGAVADAAGGAYVVEELTQQLARQGWSLLREIDARGMAAALLDGTGDGAIAQRLAATQARREERLADGRDPVLGVSAFPPADQAAEQRSVADLVTVRNAVRQRLADRAVVDPGMLQSVRQAQGAPADKDAELMPAIVAAAAAGATIGELSQALRLGEAGEQIDPLPEYRVGVASNGTASQSGGEV